MDGAAAPALATRAIAHIRIAIMGTPNTLLQFGRLNATLAGRPVSGRMSDVAGLLARWEPRVTLVPESRQGCALVRSQDCLNYTVMTSVTRGAGFNRISGEAASSDDAANRRDYRGRAVKPGLSLGVSVSSSRLCRTRNTMRNSSMRAVLRLRQRARQ
jgi:hypothetical protein